jgi:hypothetical protein
MGDIKQSISMEGTQKNFKIAGRDMTLITNKQNKPEPLDRRKKSVKKTLILSANLKATSRVRFDEEIREIEDGIRCSRHRDQFELKSRSAVRYKDLRRALLDNKPQIVHFIGHGDNEGLTIEDESGNPRPISVESLSELFGLCSDHIETVILSAFAFGCDAIRDMYPDIPTHLIPVLKKKRR